jgi:hypothetical protein
MAQTMMNRRTPFSGVDWATVTGFTVDSSKPLRVSRDKREFNCYITDRVLQLCQNGKLNVDDVVLVQYLGSEQKNAVVVDKIHSAHRI